MSALSRIGFCFVVAGGAVCVVAASLAALVLATEGLSAVTGMHLSTALLTVITAVLFGAVFGLAWCVSRG